MRNHPFGRNTRLLLSLVVAVLIVSVLWTYTASVSSQEKKDPDNEALVENKSDSEVPAADGDLDATFVTTDRPGTVLPGVSRIYFPHNAANNGAASSAAADFGRFVGVQADGKVVVVGMGGSPSLISLVRLNTNGTRDTTFGGGANDGKVTIPLPSPSGNPATEHRGAQVIKAIMVNDKTYILGQVSFGVADGGNPANVCLTGMSQPTDFLIIAVNADGTLDQNFDGNPAVPGNGNGQVRIDNRGCVDFGFGIGVQTDGKIIIGGQSTNNTATDTDFVFMRLNTDGTFDTSYDGDGKIFYDMPPAAPNNELASSDLAVVQAAGGNQNKVILFGGGDHAGHTDLLLNRLNTNGTIDMTFNGATGFAKTHVSNNGIGASKVVLYGDGTNRILAGAFENASGAPQFLAARYSGEGALDTAGFGTPNGYATVGNFMSGANACSVQTLPMLIGADSAGNVIMGGSAVCPTDPNFILNQVLTRLTGAGALDATFGTGGRVLTNFTPAAQPNLAVNPQGGTLQPDGKILTVGQVNVAFAGEDDMFAARFQNGPAGGTNADLAITKTDGVTTVTPGTIVTYTIVASNAGPSGATGATVTDNFSPFSFTSTSWTCVGAGGGTCTASGTGNINDTVNLPSGGSVTYTVTATVSPVATGTVVNTATVAAPAGTTDPNPANNSATDTDVVSPAPGGSCTTTTTNVTQSTPTAIPTGPAVVTSTVVVAGAGTYLTDVNLTTNLTHTFAADLDITLQSPAGTVITLTTDNGGANDNVFNGTLWDDDANPAGQVPYTTNAGLATDHPYVNLTTATTLVPEENFGAFIGENPNGTWTITISDDLTGDGGSLDSWSLGLQTLTSAPTITAVPTVTQSTPTAIPTGPAVVTSTVVVAGAGNAIFDVDLATTLTHTFAADLDITLQSPAGTVVTLTTDNGAGNDNTFNGTVWDDDANPAGQVPYVTNAGLATDHPYANLTTATPLAPEEAMSAFFGENPNGTWTITLSDDLTGDGGELTNWSLDIDTFTCAATVNPACAPGVTTHTQNTPTAIPTGPAVVTSTLNVAGAAAILSNLRMTTNLTHTFASDLDITLASPAGTVVTLTTDNGGGNDNVFNGTLWNNSANPFGQVPYTTNPGLVTDHAYANLTTATPLVPEESFDAFRGENPNGTWTVTISDDLAADGGSLDSWSLQIAGSAAPPVTGAPTTFNSTAPVAIPTGPGVATSTVAVTGLTGAVEDINILTNITHTFAADMDITVQAPSGRIVTLTTDNGAGNDNVFNGTTWDDDADPDGQVPYTTNPGMATDHPYVNLTTATPLTPEEALAAFRGEQPNGTWRITVSDDLAGDGGSIDSWSVVVTTNNCPLPTAAGVEVSGHVTTAGGNGIRGATVYLTDQAGNTRTALTSSFGYYRFADVEVGRTYVVSIGSKRYTFTPRTIDVNDNLSDVDFTADP